MLKNYPRVGGLLSTVIALVLGKFTIWDVWQSAHAGADSITLHMKGVVMSIVLLEFGILGMIFGDAQRIMLNPATGKLSVLGWLITIAILIPGFAGYWWFEKQLSGLGYQF